MTKRGWMVGLTLGVALAWPMGAQAEDVQADLLQQANDHYAARVDLAEARQAEKIYRQILSADPKNFEAAWRLARTYWWLGDHVPKDEKLALFDQGKEVAEEAVRLQPDRFEGHYWLGVSLGRTGEERGILNSLFLVDPIAKEMEAVLKLNPTYGQALHVLGVLYRKAPGWPLSRGDMQKSLAYARQAVANRPDMLITHVGLSETLIALGQRDEARKELTAALELPGPPDEQPETATDKTTARKLLADLQK